MELLGNFIKIQQFQIHQLPNMHVILISHFNKSEIAGIQVAVTSQNQEMKMLYISELPKCTYLTTYHTVIDYQWCTLLRWFCLGYLERIICFISLKIVIGNYRVKWHRVFVSLTFESSLEMHWQTADAIDEQGYEFQCSGYLLLKYE